MYKFTTLTSPVIPLPTENIDTDQIIPARFLKATSKEGFGNIIKNNAMNNFILPVAVSETFLSGIFDSVNQNPQTTLTVDLHNQQITNNATGKSEHFTINAYKKECFLNGFDDIDYLLSRKDKIEQYEKNRGLDIG